MVVGSRILMCIQGNRWNAQGKFVTSGYGEQRDDNKIRGGEIQCQMKLLMSNGKSNSSKGTITQTLLCRAKKPDGMTDADWKNMDVNAADTIELCLVDEVMYNAMERLLHLKLWLKLESLYMKKSLLNKFYLKLESYPWSFIFIAFVWRKVILEHMNTLIKIGSYHLRMDVKLKKV